MKTLVDLLKSDQAGRIFWLNLCAQFHENCLSIDVLRNVFKEVQAYYAKNYASDPPPDPGNAVLGLICAETEDNMVAIGVIQNVEPVSWGDIREITSVINEAGFWDHYVECYANGHQDALDELALKHGPIDHFSEKTLQDLLLEGCQSTGCGNLLDIFGGSMKTGQFKTAVDRFWASFQDSSRSKEADELVRQLGLTNFKVGQWVIEVAYNADAIQAHVENDPSKDFKRTSALCVNDRKQPRFRGLRPDEIGMTAQGGQLTWHGTTLDLNYWENPPGHPMNGLPELICSALPWSQTDMPQRINIVGKLKFPVSDPDNNKYADYLAGLFASACADEDNLIQQLEK